MATPHPILQHVADRIRETRTARGWSQQALADLAHVSRRMLGSIERGTANVSLATLDRIATALGLPFAELVREPAHSPHSTAPVRMWRGKRTGSYATLLLATAAHQTIELWEWRLAPNDRYQAEPDPPGMQELIYVLAGTLTLVVAHEHHQIDVGEAIAFRSDQPYSYINAGTEVVRFVKNVVA